MILELIYKVIYYSAIAIAINHIYLFLRYNKIVRFSWTLNGWWLPLVPFIGNIIYVIVFMEAKLNLLSGLIVAQRLFGLPFGVWYGSQFLYFNDDVEECKIILNHPKCIDKATIYNNVGVVFGNSLISVDGNSWKSRRRYLRAAFKTEILGNFMPTFFKQSNGLIRKIKNKRPDGCLFKFFTRYAFINFYLTSSGFNEEDITPEVERTGWLMDCCQDEFVKFFLNPVIPASIWLNTPLGSKLKQYLNDVKGLFFSWVHKMIEKKADPEFSDKKDGVAFIDLLLNADYKKIPGSDILGEYSLFAAAASDTTGHTLAFCFTLLGMYPEVQHKLYEEIESVLEKESIEKLNLEDLKYTEMVLNETMRLFPTAPLFGRMLGEDVNVGTRIIPKGSNFIISAYHLHRKPEYWNNPLKFDPERFSPENIQNIVPGSFLPFSSGPRNCIGQVFAMKMMVVTVVNVVRSFEIFSSHKTIGEFRMESCLSMKAGHPLDCTFKERSK